MINIDSKTLRKFLARDVDSFLKIMFQFDNIIKAMCYRYNMHSSYEDILNEVYTKVWMELDKYDKKRGKLNVWITTIANNICKNYLKKQNYYDKNVILSNEMIENMCHDPKVFDRLIYEESLKDLTELETFVFEKKIKYGLSIKKISTESNIEYNINEFKKDFLPFGEARKFIEIFSKTATFDQFIVQTEERLKKMGIKQKKKSSA